MGMDEPQPQPPDDIAAMGSPASPDALRAIVAKHQRTRTRTLGVFLAIALVAGPIAGWAIGQNGGGGTQVATGSSPANGRAPAVANAPAGAISGNNAGATGSSPGDLKATVTHLFTRTTSDGITIRAYRLDPPPPASPTTSTTSKQQQTVCPKPLPVEPNGVAASGSASGSVSSGEASGGSSAGQAPSAPPGTVINGTPPPCAPYMPPICKSAPSVMAEVSDDAAVGQGFDPIDATPTDALSNLAVSTFGDLESSPTAIVTVQTGAGVATVRLRLPAGGSDSMAPSNGVAVLAVHSPQPPPDGTVVEALDASGKVLQSMSVNQSGPKAAFACGFVGPNTVRFTPSTTR